MSEKKFMNGFVVGKFAPFHNGHKYLIDTALSHCDHVFVLSYTSERFPRCNSTNRFNWLSNHYSSAIDGGSMELCVVNDSDVFMPRDDDPAQVHREYCARMVLQVIGDRIDAVFASEPYGLLLANKFGPDCEFVMVDEDRIRFPISGTKLRKIATEDLHKFSLNVPAETYASYIPRILFLGGESTGKSTLTKKLGEDLRFATVDEYGREFFEAADGILHYPDMEHIAEVQSDREYQTSLYALRYGSDFVVCDTSPLTTAFYSRELFSRVDRFLLAEALCTKTDYDYIFLCDNDFPMVQDGTRQDEAFRETGQLFYKTWLKMHRVSHTLLRGSVGERIATIKQVIGVK